MNRRNVIVVGVALIHGVAALLDFLIFGETYFIHRKGRGGAM